LTSLATKEQILKGAGYVYNFDRALYLNRRAKKAFSVEFVEDRPLEELERRIAEGTTGTAWRFFFTKEPSATVQKELSSVLG
jgi:hypothetical protein